MPEDTFSHGAAQILCEVSPKFSEKHTALHIILKGIVINVFSYFSKKTCMAGNLQKCITDICCVGVLRPSQPNGVMCIAVSLPNHTFTGQA